MKVAIFGDVHGESKLLEKLINKIRHEEGDIELYSVGDLIDRGPDSYGVIDLCIKHNVKAIMGNHECWLKEIVNHKYFDKMALAPIMGGEKTLLSYGITVKGSQNLGKDLFNAMPETHRKFISELPAYRIIDINKQRYFLLHGGLSHATAKQFVTAYQDIEILQQIINTGFPENFIMWPSPKLGENDNLYRFKTGIQVFGHKPIQEPIIKEHFIALDTGCGTCSPFRLSAIILPSNKIIQVEVDFDE